MSERIKPKVTVVREEVDIASTLLPLRISVHHYRVQPNTIMYSVGRLGQSASYYMGRCGIIVNDRVAVMNLSSNRRYVKALLHQPTKRWLVRWKTPYGSEFGIVKEGAKKLETLIVLRVEHPSTDTFVSFNYSNYLDMMVVFPNKWTPIGIDMKNRTVLFNPYG